MFATFTFCLVLSLVLAQHSPRPIDLSADNWRSSTRTTYLFSNVYWWENADHQLTSAITLLSLAHSINATAIMPPLPDAFSNTSLIGDYFDIDILRQSGLVRVLSFRQFLSHSAYQTLLRAPPSSIPFPKNSHEAYEAQFRVLGELAQSEQEVRFEMPPEDPENTGNKCDTIGGTVYIHPKQHNVRYVFLERVHFYHFCTEKFLPAWYQLRAHIKPRTWYLQAARSFRARQKLPLTVVHIRDAMDAQRTPAERDVERYARQIADALRKHAAGSDGALTKGTLYLGYLPSANSTRRVANLLRDEFEHVRQCTHLFDCGRNVHRDMFYPPLSILQHHRLFGNHIGASLVEWALSMHADYFIGNVYAPYSRHVALYRKLQGKSYSIVKGFGEMRKIWRWRL